MADDKPPPKPEKPALDLGAWANDLLRALGADSPPKKPPAPSSLSDLSRETITRESHTETIIRPPPGADLPPKENKPSDFWTYADKAVFGLCELLALLFGLPFGDDLYHDKPLASIGGWHWFYLAIAVVFAVAGPMWPWLRTLSWVPQPAVTALSRVAVNPYVWLALLLALLAPELYRRATAPFPASTATAPAAPSIPTAPAPPIVIHDPPTAEEIAKAGGDQLRAVTGERDALKEQNNLLRQKVPNPPPPPRPPRAKPLISDLLAESGALLDIVEKTLIPLQNEWRNTLGGQNPERICLGLSSRAIQDEVSSVAERLRTADKGFSDIIKQNRIDRSELVPLIGYDADIPDPDDSPFLSSANQLENYGKTIKQLGEHPTCEDVIKADIGRRYSEMTGVLNGFNDRVRQMQTRLSDYRDALRKELRNAP